MPQALTQNQQPIPVLVYHQIDKAPAKGQPFRSLYVAPAAFARQMRFLKLLGYNGLSMSGLQPYLSGERSGKVVGITFDDGYLNNLTYALPVLKKYGFSSTCYAVSGLAGKTNSWDLENRIAQTSLMDNDQMKKWVDGGQEIGSHTRHHAKLLESTDEHSRREIALGQQDLERALGQPVLHFCYPYGRYEAMHVEMARQQGFVSATTTERSRCHAGMGMLELPRVPVLRATSLPMFWFKIATAYEDRRRK